MDTHVERFQQQKREEQVGLVFEHNPRKPPLAVGLFLRKGEDREVNVGVEFVVVGIGVMLVVLVDPPPTAKAKCEIADDEAKKSTLAGRVKNLSVAKVVPNESNLSEYKR